MMLAEILSCTQLQRTTISPGACVDKFSQIQPFMKLNEPKIKERYEPEEDECRLDTINENEKAFLTDVKLENDEPQKEDEVEHELEEEHDHSHSEGNEQHDDHFHPKKEDIYHLNHEGEPADPIELCEQGFVDVARLAGGASFGALALLDGKPRMATTKCLTRCHLLTLSKTDYNKTLATIEQKTRMLKVNFVKNIPLF